MTKTKKNINPRNTFNNEHFIQIANDSRYALFLRALYAKLETFFTSMKEL